MDLRKFGGGGKGRTVSFSSTKKNSKSHELELQQQQHYTWEQRYGRGTALQLAPLNKCHVIIKQEQFISFNSLKTVRISFFQSQHTQIFSNLAF